MTVIMQGGTLDNNQSFTERPTSADANLPAPEIHKPIKEVSEHNEDSKEK